MWLCCQFFMACLEGIANCKECGSAKRISCRYGALFHLTKYMQKNCFLQVTAAVVYTNKPPPSFVDKFHNVCQMLDVFNKHYEGNYISSWINCLNKGMNSWINQNCPGFMFVPQKPHPRGNEYHSIANGDQGKLIMW